MSGPKGQAALLRSLYRGWHLLIDAWAFFRSFKRKDDIDPPKLDDGMVDFKGEKRPNATHQSTTDLEAKS